MNKAPHPRFVNRIEVRPTTTDITLILSRVYSESVGEDCELRSEELMRVVMPYATAKTAIFEMFACVNAAEFSGGFLPVHGNARPGMPTSEHVGEERAARLEQLYEHLFGPHIETKAIEPPMTSVTH